MKITDFMEKQGGKNTSPSVPPKGPGIKTKVQDGYRIYYKSIAGLPKELYREPIIEDSSPTPTPVVEDAKGSNEGTKEYPYKYKVGEDHANQIKAAEKLIRKHFNLDSPKDCWVKITSAELRKLLGYKGNPRILGEALNVLGIERYRKTKERGWILPPIE